MVTHSPHGPCIIGKWGETSFWGSIAETEIKNTEQTIGNRNNLKLLQDNRSIAIIKMGMLIGKCFG